MGARTLESNASKKRVTVAAPKPTPDRFRHSCALMLLLATATLLAYFPVFRNDFVNYDDLNYVTENPRIQQGLTLATLRWAITSTAQTNWHPLTWISHALDCQIFGLLPAGHHFTNLLFHTANASLLFWLLWRVTGEKWRSLAVAALFALHPINVESVAWVAERKTVLSMFFFLLTLAAYGWYARKPGIARYVVMAATFVLALAAKPMVVSLPFVLLLIDFWPLGRIKGQSSSSPCRFMQFPPRYLILEKLPLIALSAASSVITLEAQRPAMKTIRTFPLADRISNAIFSYAAYVYKAIWPAHLSVFYAPQGEKLAAWQVALSLLFLGVASVVVWRKRTHAYLLVGWLWFLGTMVPMIGLVQVGEQGMADRYAYLPFIGLFTMVVWGIADVCAHKHLNVRAEFAAAGAVLLILAVLTWHQVHFWRNSFTLWSHSLQISPENYVAEDFVGITLLQERFKATGEGCANEAMAHFQNAVSIYPQDTLGRIDVGYCRQAHGDLPGAIEDYKTALQSAHNRYLKSKALLNLGAAYQELSEFATSRQYFGEALKLYPHDPDILAGVARLDAEETIAGLSQSADRNPDPSIYFRLGQLQQQMGHIADAQTSYRHALSLDPKLEQARVALESLNVGH